MDPSHLTQKSQEALHDAQTKALRYGHTEVDGEHLLLALLDQPEGIVPGSWPRRAPTRTGCARTSRPSWSAGPGSAALARLPGRSASPSGCPALLVSAEQEADRLKDEYVSVEHLSSRCSTRARTPPPGACCARRA